MLLVIYCFDFLGTHRHRHCIYYRNNFGDPIHTDIDTVVWISLPVALQMRKTFTVNNLYLLVAYIKIAACLKIEQFKPVCLTNILFNDPVSDVHSLK